MIESRTPVTEDEITITTPVATSRNVEVEVSAFVYLGHFLVQCNPDFAIVTCNGLSRFMLQISSGSYASQARDLTMCFPTYIFQLSFLFFKTSVKKQPTTKTAGEAEEQENAEQLPWKLPVAIGVPLSVVLCK